MLDDASDLRIARTVQECLSRHPQEQGNGMEVAYRRVFVDVLRRIPAADMPQDVLIIRCMVQACEFAASAMFFEHGVSKALVFTGFAPYHVHDWAVECRRFVKLLMTYWDDVSTAMPDADSCTRLILDHKDWLARFADDLFDAVEEVGEGRARLEVDPKQLCIVEDFFIEMVCFWLTDEAAKAFHRELMATCRILHEYECLRVNDGQANS